MTIGLAYAMDAELESLLAQTGKKPLETVSGVSFYEIEPGIIACAGGIAAAILLGLLAALIFRPKPKGR